MNEKIRLEDFDILGIIELQDVEGIKKYVTPIQENGHVTGYLSRSKEYYNVKTMGELSEERESLSSKLTNELSKRNFVILENMLNCSAKVYFKKFEQYILNGKTDKYKEQLEQAQACLNEDMKNIIITLQGEGDLNLENHTVLPQGEENSLKRAIEMDNKSLLYVFLQNFKINNPKNIEVLTPGYGSLYIGPMLNAMYGYNYTHMLKSKYISEILPEYSESSLRDLTSSDRIFSPKKTVFLLDDNVGTGQTMSEIKSELKANGIDSVLAGAVQYNWRNYYRVSIGEKKDIERFNISDFDFLSPFNYAGHKLYEHAIDALHSSGKEYIQYLNSKGYREKGFCDIKGAIKRAIICSASSGVRLSDKYTFPEFDSKTDFPKKILPQYKNAPSTISNPFSKRLINSIIGKIMFYREKDSSEIEESRS